MTIAKDHAVTARKKVDAYFESPRSAEADAHMLREASADALVSIAYSLADISARLRTPGTAEEQS